MGVRHGSSRAKSTRKGGVKGGEVGRKRRSAVSACRPSQLVRRRARQQPVVACSCVSRLTSDTACSYTAVLAPQRVRKTHHQKRKKKRKRFSTGPRHTSRGAAQQRQTSRTSAVVSIPPSLCLSPLVIVVTLVSPLSGAPLQLAPQPPTGTSGLAVDWTWQWRFPPS